MKGAATVNIDTRMPALSLQQELARRAAGEQSIKSLEGFAKIQDEINKSTFANTENLWLENLHRNRKAIRRAGDAVIKLDGAIGPNKCVICIGASPSLKRNYKVLHDAKDPEMFQLVAVNSALPFLLEKGIRPQYVVAVDADPVVADHLDQGYFDAHLVCSTLVHPRVLEVWKGPISFLWYELNATPARKQRRMIAKFDEGGREHFRRPWPAMGSVFNMAVALAVIVTRAQSLILVGNELSWSEASTMHVDDPDAESATSTGPKAMASTGEVVNTSPTFFLYKLLLEHLLSQFPCNVMECSEGGIFGLNKDGALPNVLHTTLRKAVDKWTEIYRPWRNQWEMFLARPQARPWKSSVL